MQGYDEKNNLLLPPRAPGESLCQELLEYYTEYCSQSNEDGSFKHTNETNNLHVSIHSIGMYLYEIILFMLNRAEGWLG